MTMPPLPPSGYGAGTLQTASPPLRDRRSGLLRLTAAQLGEAMQTQPLAVLFLVGLMGYVAGRLRL